MNDFIHHWGLVIAFFGLLGIEISPIKINPLRFLLKSLGKLLTSSIEDRLDNIDLKVTDLSHKVSVMEKNSDFKDLLNIKNNLSNYHNMLATVGLDENQFRRCFELEEKYIYYKTKYEGEVNGHMDAILDSIHYNYKKGNILKVDAKRKK